MGPARGGLCFFCGILRHWPRSDLYDRPDERLGNLPCQRNENAAFRLAPFGLLGSFAGGLSPVTPTGIVAVNVAGECGITGVAGPAAWGMALTCVLYALVMYILLFIVCRSKTELAPRYDSRAQASDPINYKQVLTLIGIVATCAVSTVLSINVGGRHCGVRNPAVVQVR